MRNVIIILIVTILTGCATAQPQMYTAQYNKVNVKNIAVINIERDDSERFTTALSSALLKAGYQVYNRTSLAHLLTEQQFQSVMADPNTMIEFGKIAGIEAGATGTIDLHRNRAYTIAGNYNCGIDDWTMTASITITDYTTGAILYANVLTESLQQNVCNGNKWYRITSTPLYDLPVTGGDPANVLMNRIVERIAIDLQK